MAPRITPLCVAIVNQVQHLHKIKNHEVIGETNKVSSKNIHQEHPQ